MRFLFYVLLALLPGVCRAETFILKDGARLEGEVTGEMDGTLLVQTRYGSLTINKADIQERKASAQPAPAAEAAPVVSTGAVVPAISTLAVTAEPAPPKLTFSTVIPSTSAKLLVYYENGVAVATETFTPDGAAPAAVDGTVKDGTYTEYYPDGALKTVKSVLGGRTSGSLKAYYPSGALQIEAYYLGGLKDGAFKYFGEDGKPLLEAAYRGDRLNGWKKEFDAAGAVKSQIYYEDDKPAEPPKPQAAAEPAKEPESMVTVKTMDLARGERFSFHLNGKYIGRLSLDKDFNILAQDGKVPDGAVKVYSKDGKLRKEFVFEKNSVKLLRVYEEGGPLKAEYTFKEDMAVKK